MAYYPNGFSKMYFLIFAHLKDKPSRFKSGDDVKAGDLIGLMGSTGNSTGVHLHYEIQTKAFNGNTAKNPLNTELWDSNWYKKS